MGVVIPLFHSIVPFHHSHSIESRRPLYNGYLSYTYYKQEYCALNLHYIMFNSYDVSESDPEYNNDVHIHVHVCILMLCFTLCRMTIFVTTGESEGFTPAINATCACPNQVLTYSCTVTGGGATIWSGTAFRCSSKRNEIILRHNRFDSGTIGVCNGGVIIARSVRVDSDNFTSQLTVNVSSGLNNRTVECIQNLDRGMMTIGEHTISIISGEK